MNSIFVPFILYTPINEKKHSTGILRKFCGNSAEIRKNPNYSAEFPRNFRGTRLLCHTEQRGTP